MPCVGNIRPLVDPAESDGDLRPWAIARVSGGIFRSNGEHPSCCELPLSSTLSGGEAPEDGGDHLIMVLKGIVVAPRWSATSSSIIGVVIEPLVLELLGQTNAVLHLVFGVLMKRAQAIEYLLVL